LKHLKPTDYKHGDTDPATGRIFLGYYFACNKWQKALYKSKTIFGAQIESMLNGAKKRAIKDELPFNVDEKFLKSIVTQTCPVFGIQLRWGTLGEGLSDNSPTLDKIKPELGYIKGNVCIISHIANKIKQDVGYEELYKLARWLEIKTKEVEENVDPQQFAPVPKRTRRPRKKYTESGIILATGAGEDDNDLDDYSGAVQGLDTDHSTQASSRDGMGCGGEEMASPQASFDFENYGVTYPTLIGFKSRGGHLPDKP